MKMMAKKVALYSMLVVLAAFLVSCSAPTLVGSNAAVYSGSRLHAVVNRDMTTVYKASVKALEVLEIEITDKAKDVFSARIDGKAANGKKIVIIIKPGEGNLTKFSIKVGSYGNKYRSGKVYDEIQKALGLKG